MINLDSISNSSPIFASVLLIIYLMLIELGSKKIKKELLPLVIVLLVVFLIIAVISIVSIYRRV